MFSLSRYIDADAFLKEYCEPYPHVYMAMSKAVADAPSIDIVRCKECKRWWGNHYHDNEDGKCPMDAWIDGDGFCSYGERSDK